MACGTNIAAAAGVVRARTYLVYLHEIRTVVVEIPKCASTSLLAVLPSVYTTSLEARHLTLKQHEGRGLDIEIGTALIREPIDRLVSASNFSVFKRSPGIRLVEFRDKLMKSLDKIGRAHV